ncbi:hypothetical protein D3C76_1261860 [compost metagenome]
MTATDEDDEALLTLVGQRRVIADEILLHSAATQHIAEQGGGGPIAPQYGAQEYQPLGQPDRLGRAVGDQSPGRQLRRIQLAREAVEVVAPGQQRQEVAALIEHIRAGDQRDGIGVNRQGADATHMVVMTVGQHDVGEGAEIHAHHLGVMAQGPPSAAIEQHLEAIALQHHRQPSLRQTTWAVHLVIHQHRKLQHAISLKAKRRHEACVLIDNPITGSW